MLFPLTSLTRPELLLGEANLLLDKHFNLDILDLHFILGIKIAISRSLLMSPVWALSEVTIQVHLRRRAEPAEHGICLPGAQDHGTAWSGIPAGSQLDLIRPSWSESSLRAGHAREVHSAARLQQKEAGICCTNTAVSDQSSKLALDWGFLFF